MASNAVTVMLNAVPAIADAGAAMLRWVAVGVVPTRMLLDIPLIDAVTVSVAVIV